MGSAVATADEQQSSESSGAHRLSRLWIPAGLAALIFGLASGAMSAVMAHYGQRVFGDALRYFEAAIAIGRFHTFSILPVLQASGPQHILDGLPMRSFGVHSHGQLFVVHDMGLSIFLAIPATLGAVVGAQAAMTALLSVLTVVLVGLAARLAGEESPWRFGAIGIFLSPAYLIASTQLFPDLLSGIVVAVCILLLASAERAGSAPDHEVIAGGVLLGVLPWIHPQNAVYVLIVMLGVVALARRGTLKRRPLVIGIAIAAVLWVLLAAYNTYVFGGPFATPGDAPLSFGPIGLTRMLGLLLDRQQGLLIQFPIIVLGVAALWLLRRRIPVAAMVTAGFVAIVIILDGSVSPFIDQGFGGLSLVGRYEWPATLQPTIIRLKASVMKQT